MRRLCRRRGGGKAPSRSTGWRCCATASTTSSTTTKAIFAFWSSSSHVSGKRRTGRCRAARRDARRGECAGSAGAEGAGKPPLDRPDGDAAPRRQRHQVLLRRRYSLSGAVLVMYRASAELAGAGPRDATRGGVNAPALPAQRGRESPLSIDRMAMLRHGVNDIKYYYEGDIRFLEQF